MTDSPEYDYDDIIGLSVETTSGEVIGKVTRVIATGANDVYFVGRGDGSEVLIPAIVQVVKEIDLETGKMVIEPMPGLLEL
jgi:16S rRNA processing protein RimM